MLNSILVVPGPPERLNKLKNDFLKNPKNYKKSLQVAQKLFHVPYEAKLNMKRKQSLSGAGLSQDLLFGARGNVDFHQRFAHLSYCSTWRS